MFGASIAERLLRAHQPRCTLEAIPGLRVAAMPPLYFDTHRPNSIHPLPAERLGDAYGGRSGFPAYVLRRRKG